MGVKVGRGTVGRLVALQLSLAEGWHGTQAVLLEYLILCGSVSLRPWGTPSGG